ncbi:hypothetical protein RRG08_036558 [Elysia crispata]|uniref:Uncharacterized protein n=1 Tax=Elysia crispata TaxID=231223 RepID=A0AAE0XXS6_9GAST|nr:hypothetical protein RRG08_036558 [Elysia crispata]
MIWLYGIFRPYFPVPQIFRGIFGVAVWDLQTLFSRSSDLPRNFWYSSVKSYTVFSRSSDLPRNFRCSCVGSSDRIFPFLKSSEVSSVWLCGIFRPYFPVPQIFRGIFGVAVWDLQTVFSRPSDLPRNFRCSCVGSSDRIFPSLRSSEVSSVLLCGIFRPYFPVPQIFRGIFGVAL